MSFAVTTSPVTKIAVDLYSLECPGTQKPGRRPAAFAGSETVFLIQGEHCLVPLVLAEEPVTLLYDR